MRTFKQILVALLIGFSSTAVLANEAKIQVNTTGHGSPIIFLPGFACPGEVWDDIVEPFSSNYECHTITYPGFNGVAAPDTLWYKTVADQLSEYISTNLDEKPILIGHSVGGTFAMDLASRGDICSKVILVDALPSYASVMMPGVPLETLTYDSPYNQSILAMDDEQFGDMVSQMTAFMVRNAEKKKVISDWMKQADRKTYTYGYTDLLKKDLRETISTIVAPVLVLAAVPFNLEQTEQIITGQFEHLSNKKIAYIENSAHFIMYDQPEWLISQIQSFLK